MFGDVYRQLATSRSQRRSTLCVALYRQTFDVDVDEDRPPEGE
ncbi:hypothetical protein ACFQJD_05510 [Haloplanus sp. GCM10025708]